MKALERSATVPPWRSAHRSPQPNPHCTGSATGAPDLSASAEPIVCSSEVAG